MKKTIIKRRKRVVAPANNNFSPSPSPANLHTVTVPHQRHAPPPTGSQIDTEMSGMQITPSSNHPQRNILAVDFTTPSRPSMMSTAPVAPMQNNGQNNNASYENQPQRKRSLSQAMEGDSPDGRGHQSIHSILNNSNRSGDVPIEPSLLALGTVELTPEVKRQQLVERKMQLERETKRIREELENCNLEIQRIDERQRIDESNNNAAMVARAAVAASAVVEN